MGGLILFFAIILFLKYVYPNMKNKQNFFYTEPKEEKKAKRVKEKIDMKKYKKQIILGSIKNSSNRYCWSKNKIWCSSINCNK